MNKLVPFPYFVFFTNSRVSMTTNFSVRPTTFIVAGFDYVHFQEDCLEGD